MGDPSGFTGHGRSGSSAYGPTSHWLASKYVDKQFMSWREIRKVNINRNKGIISVCDTQGADMRLCCTPDAFEPALRIVKEYVTV